MSDEIITTIILIDARVICDELEERQRIFRVGISDECKTRSHARATLRIRQLRYTLQCRVEMKRSWNKRNVPSMFQVSLHSCHSHDTASHFSLHSRIYAYNIGTSHINKYSKVLIYIYFTALKEDISEIQMQGDDFLADAFWWEFIYIYSIDSWYILINVIGLHIYYIYRGLKWKSRV